jgi:hypothetical protein
MISKDEWEWYGNAGHLCVGSDCRFHLCTKIGDFLISTVGEYVPPEGSREILARSRNIVLEGIGDERLHSWLDQNGFEDIGFGRTYETMVFRVDGKCGCGCGMPKIIPKEIDFYGYNSAIDATKGHHEFCRKIANSTWTCLYCSSTLVDDQFGTFCSNENCASIDGHNVKD